MEIFTLQYLIQFAVLIFALSFHEMAHAWAANRLGDPTARDKGRLTLNPIVHVDPFMTIIFPLMLRLAGSPKPPPPGMCSVTTVSGGSMRLILGSTVSPFEVSTAPVAPA